MNREEDRAVAKIQGPAIFLHPILFFQLGNLFFVSTRIQAVDHG